MQLSGYRAPNLERLTTGKKVHNGFMNTPLQTGCPQCGIGVCTLTSVTVVQMLAGMLVSVPDVAGYRCDVCGYQELTADMQAALQRLLNTPAAAPASENGRPGRGLTSDAQDNKPRPIKP